MKVDEYDIIRAITGRFPKLPRGYTQIGDDVALVQNPGKGLVLKCDMLVGKTDVPPGMGWRQAARKAVAMCVSDFAAKGVRPDSFMVSVGVPRGTKAGGVRTLAEGFHDAAGEWSLKLVGGDTSEAEGLVIDCVMVGFADRIVRRDTAKAGEHVVVTGRFGKPPAGLRILMGGARAGPGFKREAVSSVLRPEPRLEVGVALSGSFSSSIDSSDGLAICLHTISEMSGVGMELRTLPIAKGVVDFAARNSVPLEELVLYGGEEYEIVGTVPKRGLAAARRKARSAGGDLLVIGETKAGGGVRFASGEEVPRKGWIHLG